MDKFRLWHHVFFPNGHSPNVHSPITATPTCIEIYTFPDQFIEIQGSPTNIEIGFPDQFIGVFTFCLVCVCVFVSMKLDLDDGVCHLRPIERRMLDLSYLSLTMMAKTLCRIFLFYNDVHRHCCTGVRLHIPNAKQTCRSLMQAALKQLV